MAWTLTRTPTVFGNLAAEIIEITADAATQTVNTKLKRIIGFSVGKDSMASNGHTIAMNSSAVGSSVGGALGFSGFAAGDHFVVTVYGTR
jgi:hypothetical protein